MTKKVLAIASLVGLMLVGMVATTFAAGSTLPEDTSLLDLARPVYDQIMAHNYLAAAALALVFMVALVKRYAPGKLGAIVHSDAGGAATTFLMSLGGAVATATIGGATWHWSMLSTAGLVAFAAAGGYTLIKKLIIEPLRSSSWYQNKAPALLKTVLGLVFWMFDKPDAVADAEATGDAAVEAKPATGAAGVIGDKVEKF